jgi:hypothetical protein
VREVSDRPVLVWGSQFPFHLCVTLRYLWQVFGNIYRDMHAIFILPKDVADGLNSLAETLTW